MKRLLTLLTVGYCNFTQAQDTATISALDVSGNVLTDSTALINPGSISEFILDLGLYGDMLQFL